MKGIYHWGSAYLWPTVTVIRPLRFLRHHFVTAGVVVALNNARCKLEFVQAVEISSNWSLKPRIPSSKSLSASSTINHCTLKVLFLLTIYYIKERSILFFISYFAREMAGGSCFNKNTNLFGVVINISAIKVKYIYKVQ